MSLLYKEIADKIMNYINMMPNTSVKLPTEREFSLMFNVSRQTVRKALEECEQNNIIVKRQGSGIYLSSAYLSSINHVAVIVPDKDEYVYPGFISKLENALKLVSYSLTVYETKHTIGGEKLILNKLIDNPVSALVVVKNRNMLPSPLADLYRQLYDKKTNIIFIGNPNPNIKECNYIKFDDFFSGYNTAKHIFANEKNWLAIFMYDNRGSVDRYYGFVQYLQDNDLIYDESNIHWISYNDIIKLRHSNDMDFIKRIFDRYESVPGTIICGQDELAYSVIMHLKNTRKLNDDIRFFSFDSSYIKNIINVPLYTYGSDKSMFYSKIIEMIIRGQQKEKEVVTLPSSINY